MKLLKNVSGFESRFRRLKFVNYKFLLCFKKTEDQRRRRRRNKAKLPFRSIYSVGVAKKKNYKDFGSMCLFNLHCAFFKGFLSDLKTRFDLLKPILFDFGYKSRQKLEFKSLLFVKNNTNRLNTCNYVTLEFSVFRCIDFNIFIFRS